MFVRDAVRDVLDTRVTWSWRHRHRLPDTKWQRSRMCFRDFFNVDLVETRTDSQELIHKNWFYYKIDIPRKRWFGRDLATIPQTENVTSILPSLSTQPVVPICVAVASVVMKMERVKGVGWGNRIDGVREGTPIPTGVCDVKEPKTKMHRFHSFHWTSGFSSPFLLLRSESVLDFSVLSTVQGHLRTI